MNEVLIVDGARTPFLKAGAPGPFRASDLAVAAARALLNRLGVEPEALDEVIIGCVGPSPDEANIARVVSLRIGCGKRVPAWTVQRNCASGMQALDSARINIATGRSDLVLAGGTESMSHTPVVFKTGMVRWLARWSSARTILLRITTLGALRPGMLAPVIGLLRGLTDHVAGLSMGQTAENLAYRFSISREDMDRFATASHQRLALAQDKGWLDEIVPLIDHLGQVYEDDTGLRRDSSMERLAKLKPVFDKPFGLVTAGNSAQITDGAALLLLASEQAVKKHHLPVIGRLIDCEWAGVAPELMGLGPVHAVPPLLKRHGLKADNIDYWEINEAFATQVLACLAAWQDKTYCRDELGLTQPFGIIDHERLNLDGGGISLGHPVGASGARIVLHALRVLERTGGKHAVATLCIGGGQGGATLVERMAS